MTVHTDQPARAAPPLLAASDTGVPGHEAACYNPITIDGDGDGDRDAG